MELAVKTLEGKEAGKAKLDDGVFGVEEIRGDILQGGISVTLFTKQTAGAVQHCLAGLFPALCLCAFRFAGFGHVSSLILIRLEGGFYHTGGSRTACMVIFLLTTSHTPQVARRVVLGIFRLRSVFRRTCVIDQALDHIVT